MSLLSQLQLDLVPSRTQQNERLPAVHFLPIYRSQLETLSADPASAHPPRRPFFFDPFHFHYQLPDSLGSHFVVLAPTILVLHVLPPHVLVALVLGAVLAVLVPAAHVVVLVLVRVVVVLLFLLAVAGRPTRPRALSTTLRLRPIVLRTNFVHVHPILRAPHARTE